MATEAPGQKWASWMHVQSSESHAAGMTSCTQRQKNTSECNLCSKYRLTLTDLHLLRLPHLGPVGKSVDPSGLCYVVLFQCLFLAAHNILGLILGQVWGKLLVGEIAWFCLDPLGIIES